MRNRTKTIIIGFILYSNVLMGQWIQMDSLAVETQAFGSSGNYLFAGTTTTGFYYSLDLGLTWISSNQGLTNLNVRSIATKENIVIVGCEGGVFRSIDYGMTWVRANFGIEHLDIHYVLFRGDSLLIGSYGGGVYLSMNLGQNYTTINDGLFDHYVHCLFIHDSRLFAGICYGGGGIFVSDDGGATWVQKVNGVPLQPYNPNKYDDILSFTRTNQSIFASTWHSGVLKSDDNGETWTQIPIDNFVIWELAGYDESIFSAHNMCGVKKSNDNGINWEPCNEGFMDLNVCSLYIYYPYIFAGTHWGYVFRRPLDELIVDLPENPLFSLSYIFPNPVTDVSFLYYAGLSDSEKSVSIFNAEGKLCLKGEVSRDRPLVISQSHFPAGIYLYLIKEERFQVTSGKFIVE